jgi:RNA-directed DNA polymerase
VKSAVWHVMVAGRASPDDPDLAGYWAKRRERIRPPVSPATWHLLRRQRGRCPLCRGLLLYASREPHDEREWEQWHTVIRHDGPPTVKLCNPVLARENAGIAA